MVRRGREMRMWMEDSSESDDTESSEDDSDSD